MKPEDLLHTNVARKALINIQLIHKLRDLYPEYEVFNSVGDPDFYVFRQKIGESTFFKEKEKFTVSITRNIKVHCSQIIDLLKDYPLAL